MKCSWLTKNVGFDCLPLRSINGDEGLEIGTPHSFLDGTAIVVYAVRQNEHILFTDNGDTVAHLSASGLALGPARLAKLRERVKPHGLTLTKEGDFRSIATEMKAGNAFAKFMAGLLNVTEWEREIAGLDDDTSSLADEAEHYLREWRPDAVFVRSPSLRGLSRKEHTFDFLVGNEFIDVITANHTSTGAAMRKIGDLKNSPFLEGREIRVIVDDRRDHQKALAEKNILGSMAKAMMMSKLIQLATRHSPTLQ